MIVRCSNLEEVIHVYRHYGFTVNNEGIIFNSLGFHFIGAMSYSPYELYSSTRSPYARNIELTTYENFRRTVTKEKKEQEQNSSELYKILGMKYE